MISIDEEQRVFLLALHKKIDEAGSKATKALFPESSPEQQRITAVIASC